MTLADVIHGGFVHPRRVNVLAAHASKLIPLRAQVLDVGSGDGLLAAAIAERRPDLRIAGIDVLVRAHPPIQVTPFDGRTIPTANDSVDVVTCFDVLHHAENPAALLREAARVARRCIIVKDHICDGSFARWTLRAMDFVGNARHGVALPHHYWSSAQWAAAIAELQLDPAVWQIGDLGLYPWPASAVFGRELHVLTRLDLRKPVP